jgi:tRNA A-37 threonylcarbamoyl transferase component Bud32
MAFDSMRDKLLSFTSEYVTKHIPASIKLTVPELGEVDCTDVLHVVPSKRITCTGEARGKHLIIKIFYARHGAHRHWKRSYRGYAYFVEKDILAPAILYSGYIPRHGIYVLILEYLVGGLGLNVRVVNTVEISARNALLDSLMAVIAQQHKKGIVQHDLHLGNFMAAGGKIYSLDGDHVSSRHKPVGRSESFRNLAFLFAQNMGVFSSTIDELITVYGRHRGWSITEGDVEEIRRLIKTARGRMFYKSLRKMYKKPAPFVEYAEGMADPFAGGPYAGMGIFGILGKPPGKQGGMDGCEAAGFTLQPLNTLRLPILTSIEHGPWFLRRFWKASRVWRNMRILRKLGFSIADPIIIVVRRKGQFTWECSVVSRPLEGPTVRELFASGSSVQKETAVSNLSDAFSLMREAGIVLSSIHPDEIILSKNQVVFLHVDALRKVPFNAKSLSHPLRVFLQHLEGMAKSKATLEDAFRGKNLI